MICLTALLIFGILGIFSATYRQLAKEAFDCVFRRVTFRKCESGFDKKLKAKITGKMMAQSPDTAGFIFRHFEVLSLVFTILFIVSFGYSVYAVYNYAAYDNCYGPNSDKICELSEISPGTTVIATTLAENLTYPDFTNSPKLGNVNAKIVVIEFGSHSSSSTKSAQEMIKKLLKEYKGRILYVWKDFPDPDKLDLAVNAEAARCAGEQGKYWEYHELLFEKQGEIGMKDTMLLEALATELNLNQQQFNACVESRKYRGIIKKDFEDSLKADISETSTFLVNKKVLVSPASYKILESVVDAELKQSCPIN